MILCVRCRKLWPAGSLYCGHCGKSFGGSLCSKRHLNPAKTDICLRCGSDELTDTARSLNLRTIALLLAWSVALLILKTAVHNAGRISAVAFSVITLLFEFVAGFGVETFLAEAFRLLVLALLIVGFVSLAFPKQRDSVWRFTFRALRSVTQISLRLSCSSLKALATWVQGRQHQKSQRGDR